jgi:cytochrome bd-type quinol oxidase subunit 2
MKKSSTLFLQIAIVLVGIAVLAFMLIMPHHEGVNANATSLREIYFDDPFLAYVYLGSIPFFFGLFQAIKLLGFVNKNKVFSQDAIDGLRKIKYCAFITAGAIIAAGIFLRIAAFYHDDDPAGALMLGMIATFASVVVGTAAALFERVLQKAVDMKSENDLTV